MMGWSYNKYGSQKVERDGITFDSQKECRRWYELKLLQKAGEITDLQRQVSYELVPAQYELILESKGKPMQKAGEITGLHWQGAIALVPVQYGLSKGKCLERAVSYIADFVYKDRSGAVHVEDTKGVRTKEYIIKRKLMLWIHGIRIEEI